MNKSPIAIITGGAKRIGAYISLHLAKTGYDIIMHYNNSQAEAEITAAEIREQERKVYLFKANLMLKSEREKFIAFCAKYNNIRVLINNAAVFINDSIRTPDIEDSLSQHLNINTIAPIAIVQGITKIVSTTYNLKPFDVINILDYSIFKVPHNFFSYHLSKKILYNWTQLAAKQLSPDMKVNGIALGQILKNTLQSQDKYDTAITDTLLGCSGTIEEVYQTISFILNTHSMTGQVICLDGGMHISDLTYR
jgi:NAD(P)-dependent dehydrogenase (short-subunit alcohol dehydrogenase family)